MNYLIFDIECCDGKHICEFGYVLFNEKFDLLKKECITINPEREFKLSGREHEKDMSLAFSEEVYYHSPTYKEVYNKIKEIILTPDCQIIGFAMMNDAMFLATANEVYGTEPVEFSFLDFQTLYQAYSKAPHRISIEKCAEELGLEGFVLHKSDDDSYAVMLALQKICEKERLSVSDMLTVLKKMKGNYMAEKARLRCLTMAEKMKAGNLKAQKEFLHKFLRDLTPNEGVEHYLTGKRVCIDMDFQKNHFNAFLSLIQKIYSVGGVYTGKASECNVFIKTHDGEDVRQESVQKAISEGSEVQVVALCETMELLQCTLESLEEIDYTKNVKPKRKNRSYVESKEITLGEMLMSKGFTLLSIA